MPEQCKLVLAYVHGSFGNPWMETAFIYEDGTWAHIGSEDVVTHWQPLPDPPKE
jgi:hypothetical protein